LECPQYLRKSLFPPHKYLEHVGLLSPLEAPHHLKINDEWTYREGVITDIPIKENKGSWVDIGLKNVKYIFFLLYLISNKL
jgi:predicted SPOUT superfamily RNA methylase MTH1